MRVETEEAMRALGVRIGELAEPGTVVALQGDLGAGKSVLARGIARGLGIPGRVPSPTFILVAEYTTGRLPLHHADLYRLSEPSELENLGLDEVLGSDGLVVVEWADRFAGLLPEDSLVIRIAIEADPMGPRVLGLTAGGPRSRRLLDGLVE